VKWIKIDYYFIGFAYCLAHRKNSLEFESTCGVTCNVHIVA